MANAATEFKVIPGTLRAHLVAHFIMLAKSLDEKIAKFAKDMVEDPIRALEWSDKVFTQAATRAVALQAVECLQMGLSREKIYNIFLDNVLNKARFVPKSTSIQSDRVKAEMAAAAVEVLDTFKNAAADLDASEIS